MELVPKRSFLNWLGKHGIGFHPDYPGWNVLIYLGISDYSRFWIPSPIVPNLLNFINAALNAASDNGPFYLYRRSWGTWYYAINDDLSLRNQIINIMITSTGIPQKFRGALKYEVGEWREILTIISAHYVFGWSVNEDLYIIPESGDCILMVSHHGQLNGEFPSEGRLTEFIAAMAKKGYELPDWVPDETFETPPWMLRDNSA